MKTNVKTVVSRVSNILLSVLVVLLILLTAAVLFCKATHRVFFLFGHAPVWVLTESMEDTIPRKSFILIREASAKEVKVGDIVTFYSSDPALNGALNTHRVIAVRENGNLVTRGDHPAALVDRYEVFPENVVGVCERSLPFLTVFGRIFQTPYGICLAASLILFICLLCYLPTLKKTLLKTTEKPSAEKKNEIDRRIALEVERLKKEGLSSDNSATAESTKEQTNND